MAAVTFDVDDLGEGEETILATLAEETHVRRVDLADALGDRDAYPEHERALLSRDALEEVGAEYVTEEGEDGEDQRVTYRRFTITARGERLLRELRSHDPDSDPDPVAPSTEPTQPRRWDERAPWTDLAENVPRLLEETQSVERVDTEDGRHDWAVRVTLARDGAETTVEFNAVRWHNATARGDFVSAYRGAFGEMPGISERAFGVLQARWVDEYADGGDA
jgi:hypothetical protein